MSRQCCEVCERPLNACICAFISPVKNETQILVLQHPSEVTQTKGTVALLAHSLERIKVFVGEDFTQHKELQKELGCYEGNVSLLYPSDKAINVADVALSLPEGSSSNEECHRIKKHCLIVLDGTWKKAYRLFMLNDFLQALPHVTLPEGLHGEYVIRKTAKANALSTLEACCYALQIIEKNTQRYTPLFENFRKFNEFQLTFRPSHHIEKG